MESNSVEKFKATASTPRTSPIFKIFYVKKDFSKLGHGNLVLILQVDWDRNFDDIRTGFLHFWTYHGFSRSLCYDNLRHLNLILYTTTNTHVTGCFILIVSVFELLFEIYFALNMSSVARFLACCRQFFKRISKHFCILPCNFGYKQYFLIIVWNGWMKCEYNVEK